MHVVLQVFTLSSMVGKGLVQLEPHCCRRDQQKMSLVHGARMMLSAARTKGFDSGIPRPWRRVHAPEVGVFGNLDFGYLECVEDEISQLQQTKIG